MKKIATVPLLSIIVPTLNNEKDMPRFMESLTKQTFPDNKVELLVLDGGSHDHTVRIAKKYGAIVIHNPGVLAESGVNRGISKAHGDLLMILAVDNIFSHEKSIETMVKIFEDTHIYAAFPKQVSDVHDSIYTKYHNTFTDPFNHFVYGYSANARTFNRVYTSIITNDVYDIYDYRSRPETPLIAFAQGFTIRGAYRNRKGNQSDDIMPIIQLLAENKRVAYVHSVSIIHHTTRNLDHFIRKQRWATNNFLSKKKYGISYRFPQLSARQKLRMNVWPLYALSFVVPTIVGIYGIIRDRERMWIFHPILCFVSALASMYEILTYNISGHRLVSRQ